MPLKRHDLQARSWIPPGARPRIARRRHGGYRERGGHVETRFDDSASGTAEGTLLFLSPSSSWVGWTDSGCSCTFDAILHRAGARRLGSGCDAEEPVWRCLVWLTGKPAAHARRTRYRTMSGANTRDFPVRSTINNPPSQYKQSLTPGRQKPPGTSYTSKQQPPPGGMSSAHLLSNKMPEKKTSRFRFISPARPTPQASIGVLA